MAPDRWCVLGRKSIAVVLFSLCISSASLFAQFKPSHAISHRITVPFVGCKSDGQIGPMPAPRGVTKTVTISPDVARQLAYYKAAYESVGVLAPRGWYCFGTYGSNGTTLYVSPGPISSAQVFSSKRKPSAGPAIQLSVMDGGTSGRFSVAQTIARVFPAHMSFTQSVIEEGLMPASDFPVGPYPKDKLTYRSDEVVEFQTPANEEGLGTKSWIQKNGSPINGVAILFGKDTNLLHLSMRLPIQLDALTPAIIQQVERDVKCLESSRRR